MAEITKELGRIPVSRGNYQATTEYYKDNIVQYKRGSYQVVSESPIIGISPTNDKNIVNPGWTLFAGTLDAQDIVNQIKEQEAKSIQAVAARETEILAKSDAAKVSFDNTGTSLSGTNVQGALEETDGKINQLKNAGYLYAGIATPTTNPGTPEGHVFYLASVSGIYTNFNNYEVTNFVCIFRWLNNTWFAEDTDILIGNFINTKNQEQDEKIFRIEKTIGGELKGIEVNNHYISNDNKWIVGSYYGSYLIECTGIDTIIIKASSSDGHTYAFVKEVAEQDEQVDYATGYTSKQNLAKDTEITLNVPDDAKFIFIWVKNGSSYMYPQSIRVKGIEEKLKELIERENLDLLTTLDKSSLVGAINEVNTKNIELDDTLTSETKAAQAKAVGDELLFRENKKYIEGFEIGGTTISETGILTNPLYKAHLKLQLTDKAYNINLESTDKHYVSSVVARENGALKYNNKTGNEWFDTNVIHVPAIGTYDSIVFAVSSNDNASNIVLNDIKAYVIEELTLKGAMSQVFDNIGNIEDLKTGNKSSLVIAINEVENEIKENTNVDIVYKSAIGVMTGTQIGGYVDYSISPTRKSCHIPIYMNGKDKHIVLSMPSGISLGNARFIKDGKLIKLLTPSQCAELGTDFILPSDEQPDYVDLAMESSDEIPSTMLPLIYAIWKGAEVDDSKLPSKQIILGSPQLYYSEPTGNESLDSLTTSQIYSLFDSLCNDNPKWLRKNTNICDTDCSGNYEVRRYTLEFNVKTNGWLVDAYQSTSYNSEHWNSDTFRKKTLFVMSGAHGDEKSSIYGLYLGIKDIVESTEQWAMFLKSNFIIEIVPIINPWGVDNSSRNGYDGSNFNRTYYTDAATIEITSLKTFLESIKGRLCGCIDLHNTEDVSRIGMIMTNPFYKFYDEEVLIATQLMASHNHKWSSLIPNRTDNKTCLRAETSGYIGSSAWYFDQILGVIGHTVESPRNYNDGETSTKTLNNSNSCQFTKDCMINLLQAYGNRFII